MKKQTWKAIKEKIKKSLTAILISEQITLNVKNVIWDSDEH